VNVFLYQVAPNNQLRGIDLPTRRPDGTAAQRPLAPVDLCYLISFHGDDSKMEPQILLGVVTRALHAQPVITRQMISDMLADPTFSFMTGTDLQDAPDLVRLTTVPLTLEELSKLWTVVFQTPYVLSQVYRAGTVIIEGLDQPQAALPVARTVLGVNASMGPVIDLLLSQHDPTAPLRADAPVVTGDVVALVGRDLLTEITRVRVGGVELEPEAKSATSSMLKVQLPPAVLAGVQAVSVVQRKGAAPSPLDRVSNSVAFQLRPTVTATFAAGAVTVGFTPPVAQRQQVTLVLSQLGGAGQVFTFDLPLRAVAPPQSTLVVPVPGVPPGDYLVRVKVDGAESLLAVDPASGRYDGPKLTIP
jgi:hypothetical protein